jgi:hypothetical protein
MKRKKRSGTNAASAVRFGLRFVPIALAALACVLTLQGAKKKTVPEGYSLVAGSVFNAAGYAIPDADVVLMPDPQPDSAPLKIKKLQTVCDSRGEFTFRVPPSAMHYILSAGAKGYRAAQKPVVVQGEERVDVTFQLEPESK